MGNSGGITLAQTGALVALPRPIPIALFFSSFVPGGTERQMIELSRRLDRRVFAVHLVCFHRCGAWQARAEEHAVSVTEFPITGFRRAHTFHQMRAFARWCRATDIALVHTLDIYANIFGLPAAATACVPVRIGNRRVITVANLRPEKAHEILIDAAASLVATHPGLEFHVVGDGPRLAELTALAAARGMGDRVRFFGHRDDVPALLRESDIFVLPSRSEAFPNGLIEAMAAGLPVVATAVGGIVELVRHGENGLLVRPGDSRDLANAIQQLV